MQNSPRPPRRPMRKRLRRPRRRARPKRRKRWSWQKRRTRPSPTTRRTKASRWTRGRSERLLITAGGGGGGKGRRKAPFSLLRAFDDDHAAARSLLAQLDERRVFRRAVPLQGLLQRRKFKHREALRRPAAFERLHLAAAHGISAAVLGDDRGNLLAVLLVGGRVRDQ